MSSSLLCEIGHIATAAELKRRGVNQYRLNSAVLDGRVTKLRRGVYACAHVDSSEATAARLGGAVTCVSVLRAAGVWAGNSKELHVQIPRGWARPQTEGVCLHWETPKFAMDTPWRAGRMQSLWRAIHCLDKENAIAAMESTIHLKFLEVADVRRVARLAPRRLSPDIHHLNPNSQSGNETIVRRRLQCEGYSVETQATVPGMGHHDLLIEDCLAVEVDGKAWHGEDRYESDRSRDLHSEGLGRHVLRLSSRQIHVEWTMTMAVIERMVRDAIAERDRRVGRTVIRASDDL